MVSGKSTLALSAHYRQATNVVYAACVFAAFVAGAGDVAVLSCSTLVWLVTCNPWSDLEAGRSITTVKIFEEMFKKKKKKKKQKHRNVHRAQGRFKGVVRPTVLTASLSVQRRQ